MRKYLAAIVAVWLVAACDAGASRPETRADQLARSQENTDRVNVVLPLQAFAWDPNDGEVGEAERAYITVARRLGIPYRSSDADSVGTTACNYRGSAEGSVLVRLTDGQLWRVVEINGYYPMRRGYPQNITNVNSIVFVNGDDSSAYQLSVRGSDVNRFMRFAQVLCTTDGRAYADAWMEYRHGYVPE